MQRVDILAEHAFDVAPRIEDLPQLINVFGEMSSLNGDARSPSLFD